MKDDGLYISHIGEAAARIVLYGQDGEARFREDIRTQDAIIRDLQVMGEAVKKISADTRAAHPEVPWKDIAGDPEAVVRGVRRRRRPAGPAQRARKSPAAGPEPALES